MGIARIAICDISERLSPESMDHDAVRPAELAREIEYVSDTSLEVCRYGRGVISTSSKANTRISVATPRRFEPTADSLSVLSGCRAAETICGRSCLVRLWLDGSEPFAEELVSQQEFLNQIAEPVHFVFRFLLFLAAAISADRKDTYYRLEGTQEHN